MVVYHPRGSWVWFACGGSLVVICEGELSFMIKNVSFTCEIAFRQCWFLDSTHLILIFWSWYSFCPISERFGECGTRVSLSDSTFQMLLDNCVLERCAFQRDRFRLIATLANSCSPNFWMLNFGQSGAPNCGSQKDGGTNISRFVFVEFWRCLKRRGPEMCSSEFSGCRVKPRPELPG